MEVRALRIPLLLLALLIGFSLVIVWKVSARLGQELTQEAVSSLQVELDLLSRKFQDDAIVDNYAGAMTRVENFVKAEQRIQRFSIVDAYGLQLYAFKRPAAGETAQLTREVNLASGRSVRFDVSADLAGVVAQVTKARQQLLLGLGLMAVPLSLFMWWLVHVLGLRPLKRVQMALAQSNTLLEQRVEERTRELQKAYGENRAITEAIHDNLYMLDTSDRLIWWNARFEQTTGHTAESLNGMPGVEFFVPEDRDLVAAAIRKVVDEGYAEAEARFVTKSGPVYYHFNGVRVLNSAGEFIGIAGVGRDISLRKEEETELRIAATAFESQESLIITDADGMILRINHAFTESTGYTAEEAVGQTPHLLKSGRHDAEFYRAMWESIHRTGTWQGEIWDRRKNGEIFPKLLTISAVVNNDGVVTHYIGSHIDISERKAAEERIQHLAFHDQLTDLPNRVLLLDRLQQALVSSARGGQKGALLFIDMDNFKNINDTLGHAMGDMLLQQVTQRLVSCIRKGDTVSRLGGDEFVAMLLALSEQPIEAAAQVEAIGEKILTALSQSYQLDKNKYRCTASIGVTLFSGNQLATEELMKQADIAMYQAKKAGRNTLRFFDQGMQESISARVSLENELHNALEFRQFHLHYQIQVDSAYRPLGAEALIRWIHPERKMVSPAQFIPLAEETGLILSIGQWVLETACAQIKAWEQDKLTRDLILAVNVSAKQFHQVDFVAQVKEIIQRHAINPMLLKLELTEGMLLDNIEDTIATMNSLSEIGVQFSLDDFGTGYSSLQYLKRLPLNQLKIDQSFVRDIATDSSDIAIVRTIIAMAQSLKMDVIAEGVEMEDQRQLLLNSGCSHFQGYLFSRPVPIEQFEALLKQS